MRIALMVVRIFFKAIVYFIQISYCGHSKKVTFEQTYRIIQNAAKNANRAGRVTVEVHGEENIPKEDGFIYFPNHQGMFDVLAFLAISPRPFTFVFKKEAANLPLVKQVIRALHAYAIDREDIRQDKEVNKEGFTPLEEIRKSLKELPDHFAEIAKRDDVFAITYGSARVGQQLWEQFLADIRFTTPSQVILTQFTVDEDPIYYFIEYNGDSFHIVVDSTRDGYDEESGYAEGFWNYLKVEGYEQEDGSITEYAFLCDNCNLTYRMVQDYYAGNTSSVSEEPSVWDFYIRNIPQQEFAERREKINPENHYAVRTYTGYADVLPVYANGNAYKDYDKDGILDRIYRTYRVESDGEEVVQVYCFLGNGNTIVLDDNLWGDTFSTYCFDFNEDEIRDICFVQQQNAQDGIRSGAAIYASNGETYGVLPFSREVYFSSSPEDTDRGLKLYTASTIEVFQDRDGTNALRCSGTVTHDEKQYDIRWTLYYRDGKWRIRDVKENESIEAE